jgi:hypothetical protein
VADRWWWMAPPQEPPVKDPYAKKREPNYQILAPLLYAPVSQVKPRPGLCERSPERGTKCS